MSANSKCSVLIVEDETLIAMLLEDMIMEIGHKVIGPAHHLDEAIHLARNEDLDCALLDLVMGGKLTYAVADILKSRHIPFAFVSGYGMPPDSVEFAKIPVLQKPFSRQDIGRLIGSIVPHCAPAVP